MTERPGAQLPKGWDPDFPKVCDVPVVEVVNGWEMIGTKGDGSVGDCDYSCRRGAEGGSVSCARTFGNGTGAEDVENYGNGEGEQVRGDGALGSIELGLCGFAGCGRAGVHCRNVAFLEGCGKGRGD